MAQHDLQYLALVQDVLHNGKLKPNRTGVDTISVFGREMRFDLRDGTIPLLTTKKMHVRSIIRELLWYIRGETSSNLLELDNVTIWKEWKDDRGELGPVYGHLWRNWPSQENVVWVEPKNVTPPTVHKKRQHEQLVPEIDSDSFCGRVLVTRECGNITVVRRDGTTPDGEGTYTVQFNDTGYTITNKRKSVITRGHITDPYKPRVYGVGYLGTYDKQDPSLKQLQRHWYKMLERCYDSSTPEYVLYGGAGVSVHPDWLCFATFQQQVKTLPNWNNKRLNPHAYELDKDFFSSSVYSTETCVWLPTKHNTLYRKDPKPFMVHTPTGEKYTHLSVSDVCHRHGLIPELVYKVLNGKATHHKGYTFTFINPPTSTAKARLALPVDQLGSLIEELNTNPNSRRLIVTAWNPALLPNPRLSFEDNIKAGLQALPPCHYTFQCYAQPLDDSPTPKYELSLKLSQRSCDVGLGVPFNIVQYSLLLRMLCEVTGMTPGDLIWSGGDVHIYTNHISALEEQLTRTPYDSPAFSFARHVGDIDQFQYEDFIIHPYQTHDKLVMDVAV